jgi:hypothetical protein
MTGALAGVSMVRRLLERDGEDQRKEFQEKKPGQGFIL